MPPVLDVVVLLDCIDGEASLLEFTREPDVENAVASLGESIVANPSWDTFKTIHLLARVEPYPLLAAIGEFSNSERRRLQDLAAMLQFSLRSFRYLDYRAAERVATRLAARLLKRLGAERLARATFTAIPRGGLLVLGMLAYLLDLRPEQLHHDPGVACETLVVVDDCALSGVRFREFVQHVSAQTVVFSPLVAPEGLCLAIERSEPKLEACVCGDYLQDLAPERFGREYSAWCETRREQQGVDPYWVGIPEYVAFAWNEPQTKYWNPEASRFEPGWNVVPPRICLKRRGSEANAAPLKVCRASVGCIYPADRVLWAEVNSDGDEVTVLVRIPPDASEAPQWYHLDRNTAVCWSALIRDGSVEGAAAELRERYDVEPEVLRNDLAEFVSDLTRNGILRHVED